MRTALRRRSSPDWNFHTARLEIDGFELQRQPDGRALAPPTVGRNVERDPNQNHPDMASPVRTQPVAAETPPRPRQGPVRSFHNEMLNP